MTKDENKKRIKAEALNKIRKIYNPKGKVAYSEFFTEDGSYAEQRDYKVSRIIFEMEKELNNL